MDIDTIVLKFEAVFNKMKSDLGNTIEKWKQLDSATSGVANTFDKMSTKVNTAMSNMTKGINVNDAKEKLQVLQQQLSDMKSKYKSDLEYFNQNKMAFSTSIFDARNVTPEQVQSHDMPILRKEDIDAQREKILALKGEIRELKTIIGEQPKGKIVPKTEEELQQMRNVGNAVSNTKKKLQSLSGVSKLVESSFSKMGKALNSIKKSFSNFGTNITKSVDKNFRSLKKLGLGLIGVRTAMSLLTRGVNAYLSFDSELQESITNSWNMLGSLLAPAIELVANLFAMATNYVAQFISTLTGIDLVARANAKALDTQAKANAKANSAQRGLLGMDEITNLPTESATNPVGQITTQDIKKIGIIDDFLNHLKSKQWHLAGEDIAHAINRGLQAINWDNIKSGAYDFGHNIATFLNGVFELNWYDLGRNFGEGINTMIKFAQGFVDEFSIIQLMGGLAKSLNKSVETIDWEQMALTLSDGLINLFTGIQAFLDQVDWEQLGENIKTFLMTIKWGEIGESIASAINAGFEKALPELMRGAFGDTVGDYFQQVTKNAGDMLNELLSLVGDFVMLVLEPLSYLTQAIDKFRKGDILLGTVNLLNAIISVEERGINIMIDLLNLFLTPFRAIIAQVGNLFGANWSVGSLRIPPISVARIAPPKLATGTNDIETEGLYHLHEGEAVVPKKYNPATGGYDNGADNKQIIDLLIALNSNFVDYADRPININMNSRKVAEAIYDDTENISRTRTTTDVVKIT